MPLLPIGAKHIHHTDFKPDGATKETIIFMHGLGSSQNYFAPMVPTFTKNGFRCIVFDNPSAARSPHVAGIEHNVNTLSNDIIAILDALVVSKAIMVGHSMGGMVAAHLSAMRSDRIVASVWIGPVYPQPSVASIFEGRINIVQKDGMEAMANTIPQTAVAVKASPLVRAMIRELLLGQTPEGYISNCKVIAEATPPMYADIKIPVLVIAGDEDKSAPLEFVKKMYSETGTEEKKLIVLEGVGHWQCLEAPDLVAKHILDFYHEIQ